jgi:broad specificity phosphatase PhoE
MRLHLVRHAKPSVDPSAPASAWPLDPSTADDVEALRDSGVLPGPEARWVSSTERKALQTAKLLHAREVMPLDELREQHRPADWVDADEFQSRVVRALERPTVPARPGWETADAVRRRVLDALHGPIRASLGSHDDDVDNPYVVLVGHGTAWTILVSALTGRSPDLDAWHAMAMPDHCQLLVSLDAAPDETSATLALGWGGWRR